MTAPLQSTPQFDRLLGDLVAAEVARRIAELQRPEYVTQRTVAAICGMPARDYLRHCRLGHWPVTADRRLRLSRTADVLAWIEGHPVQVRAANDSSEAELFAKSRSGLRRVGA